MKTLFYIGRPYPHIAELQTLKSLGYKLGLFLDKTHTLRNPEIFDFCVALDFTSLESVRTSLLQIHSLPAIDGLLCLYENYIPHKTVIAEHLSLPAMSMQSALACTDKYEMRTKFQKYNPEITPKFTFVESKNQLLKFAANAGYPVMLKPTNLVKSLLVSKCSSENELIENYDKTIAQIEEVYARLHITDREPRIIAEQFIEGSMCSVAAYVDHMGEPHFCDGIAELTTAQDIGFDDNFLYSRKLTNTIKPDLLSRILAVARDGVHALSMRSSPAHIEIIYNEQEIKIVEIGARTGGYRPRLYRESYGLDLIQQEALIAVGDTPQLAGDFKKYSAIYELFPRTKGTFVRLDGDDSTTTYSYLHRTAKSGDIVGPAQEGFRSVAVFGVSSPDYQTFISRCKQIEAIKVITS